MTTPHPSRPGARKPPGFFWLEARLVACPHPRRSHCLCAVSRRDSNILEAPTAVTESSHLLFVQDARKHQACWENSFATSRGQRELKWAPWSRILVPESLPAPVLMACSGLLVRWRMLGDQEEKKELPRRRQAKLSDLTSPKRMGFQGHGRYFNSLYHFILKNCLLLLHGIGTRCLPGTPADLSL